MEHAQSQRNRPQQRDYFDRGTIHSLSEYVDTVLSLQRDLSEDADASYTNRLSSLWLRGQARGAPELAPTVLRDWFVTSVCQNCAEDEQSRQSAILAMELQLNRQFRRQGASLLPASASLVDIYFLAQHHGMPTRLLDWTTNPLAALFFAVTSHLEEDGMVLATVPDWRLTAESADDSLSDYIREAPFDVRSELVVKTISTLFGESREELPGVILPIVPDLHAGRMLQQGSCFTLHVPGSKPIPKNVVVRINVPQQRKTQLEAELRSLGVAWATLFPDLDHLSYDIRTAWNLWPE